MPCSGVVLTGPFRRYRRHPASDRDLAREVSAEVVRGQHDVLAERHGTVGELRRELERGAPLEHHTSVQEWLIGDRPSG